jgi:hypothetical protein
MPFTSVITGKIFELVCTYLHFTGNESVPTYQGPSRFLKIYPLLSFEQKILIPVNYQTRTDERLIPLCTGRPLMKLSVKLLFPAYCKVIMVIHLVYKNITILIFIIRNGLKQGDTLLPLLFNFALEYAFRMIHVIQDGLKLTFWRRNYFFLF